MSTFTIKEDLISLIWPINTCYSKLIDGLPRGVTVDIVTGTWTFQEQTQPIGSRIDGPEDTDYPIGVYDRTKLLHLKAMKRDIEWVKKRNERFPIDA